MNIKTTELTGAALDWAVAKAVKPDSDSGEVTQKTVVRNGEVIIECQIYGDPLSLTLWRPSRAWAQGGPLIEQRRIVVWHGTIYRSHDDASRDCAAKHHGMLEPEAYGATYLEAACRAIVAAKLGETVNIPDELCAVVAQSVQHAPPGS